MTPQRRLAAMIELGGALEGRDLECYRTFDRDPCLPILGEGDPEARIALFGRDPGRDEVRYGIPFIGAGGQKLRAGLHRALFGSAPADLDASITAGRYVFWANMVPFKPIDNKAWPTSVVKRFRPFIADLLLNGWHGHDAITLGEGAFKWFGLGAPRPVRDHLAEHWRRADRFETTIEVPLVAVDPDSAAAAERKIRLHPLPHPSPLNATWTPHFPRLLEARLRSLGFDLDHWRR